MASIERGAWAVGLATWMLVSSAGAQEPPAADPEVEAREKFELAAKHADAAEWAAACPLFDQAHQLHPTPGTRFRLAECYEHLGDVERAKSLYRAILGHAEEETVPSRIDIARARLAALGDTEVVCKVPPAPPPPSVKPAPAEPPSMVPGIVLVSVGGAGIALGAIMGAVALAEESDLRDACPNDVCPPDQREAADAVETKALVADVSLGAGIAFAASGVLFLVISAMQGPQASGWRHPGRFTLSF